MLTNVLLVKISIALAALLAVVGLWYREYHQEALERACIKHQIVRRHPTREQREEADRLGRNEMTGEGLARA
jgi:FtsZ-interacting cell division protein ZipA